MHFCRPLCRGRSWTRQSRSRLAPWSGPRHFWKSATWRIISSCGAATLFPNDAANSESGWGAMWDSLLRTYRTEGAELVVVALGSVNGTVQDVVDDIRGEGVSDCVCHTAASGRFRSPRCGCPIGAPARRRAGEERSPPVSAACCQRMSGSLCRGTAVRLHTAIAGLGGRAITKHSLRRLFRQRKRCA